MNIPGKYFFFVLILSTQIGVAYGHHSVLAYFNMDDTAEIEGVISSVHWRNPHVRFVVDVTDSNGQVTGWDVELSALSMFRNRGYIEPFMQAGDRVQVHGNPAYRGRAAMFGLNMLKENGTEVVLEASAGSYYRSPIEAQVLSSDSSNAKISQLARESADGIFRVWSTPVADPDFPMFRGNYPLTDNATNSQSEWVVDEHVVEGCWSKSMPYLMITPAPIEFVVAEKNILMRFEEDDAQRFIYMNPEEESVLSTQYGHSIGKWEGNTLVVETSRIDTDYFDDRGTPQSEQLRVIERFTPSENGMQLAYQITITDPEVFAEPLDFSRTFVWQPERKIEDWDCAA